MNSVYLINRAYRWLAISATFVHVSAALYSPAPLPEGSSSIQVPLAQYRPQRTFTVRPPLDEGVAQPEAEETHHRIEVRLNSPPYRGPTYTVAPNYAEQIIVIEADELHADRRVVSLVSPPYKGPTWTQAPQYADNVIEADETHSGRRVIVQTQQPYKAPTFAEAPQIADEAIPADTEELFNARRAVVPRSPNFAYPVIATNGVPGADGEVAGTEESIRRSATVFTRPTYNRPNVVALQIQLAETVAESGPEGDKVIEVGSSHSDYSDRTFVKQGHLGIESLPEGDKVIEVGNSYRDYSDSTFVTLSVTAADVIAPLDELIAGRRVVQLAPKPKYKSHIAFDAYANNRPDVVVTTRRNLPLLGVG